ncbi:uncharacterized protein MONOS_8519 [Monocercomonoides exilis]|uniref:uncharacterized protein n=1 Tax=Monocercomonoides exilis TaxID=2049356 RepID=UPI00355A4D4F|nr:hypothetical protein MONOS_8519 [Monocercomonoides exilis]|eukprot:MONOS_8519.1-p1 / transcript=MONOS_8519.1 / gene=MONOS_8519 / organism=Monocercomonoides_exilis_PA203 / gene_product=unspecified product / transcript_product=unspecified product / location=Mono_scaffold00323:46147-51275(-) / protein_length=1617 / sequence_SO=supercontig / SO=protein_coding / is_pseudo=false
MSHEKTATEIMLEKFRQRVLQTNTELPVTFPQTASELSPFIPLSSLGYSKESVFRDKDRAQRQISAIHEQQIHENDKLQNRKFRVDPIRKTRTNGSSRLCSIQNKNEYFLTFSNYEGNNHQETKIESGFVPQGISIPSSTTSSSIAMIAPTSTNRSSSSSSCTPPPSPSTPGGNDPEEEAYKLMQLVDEKNQGVYRESFRESAYKNSNKNMSGKQYLSNKSLSSSVKLDATSSTNQQHDSLSQANKKHFAFLYPFSQIARGRSLSHSLTKVPSEHSDEPDSQYCITSSVSIPRPHVLLPSNPKSSSAHSALRRRSATPSTVPSSNIVITNPPSKRSLSDLLSQEKLDISSSLSLSSSVSIPLFGAYNRRQWSLSRIIQGTPPPNPPAPPPAPGMKRASSAAHATRERRTEAGSVCADAANEQRRRQNERRPHTSASETRAGQSVRRTKNSIPFPSFISLHSTLTPSPSPQSLDELVPLDTQLPPSSTTNLSSLFAHTPTPSSTPLSPLLDTTGFSSTSLSPSPSPSRSLSCHSSLSPPLSHSSSPTHPSTQPSSQSQSRASLSKAELSPYPTPPPPSLLNHRSSHRPASANPLVARRSLEIDKAEIEEMSQKADSAAQQVTHARPATSGGGRQGSALWMSEEKKLRFAQKKKERDERRSAVTDLLRRGYLLKEGNFEKEKEKERIRNARVKKDIIDRQDEEAFERELATRLEEEFGQTQSLASSYDNFDSQLQSSPQTNTPPTPDSSPVTLTQSHLFLIPSTPTELQTISSLLQTRQINMPRQSSRKGDMFSRTLDGKDERGTINDEKADANKDEWIGNEKHFVPPSASSVSLAPFKREQFERSASEEHSEQYGTKDSDVHTPPQSQSPALHSKISTPVKPQRTASRPSSAVPSTPQRQPPNQQQAEAVDLLMTHSPVSLHPRYIYPLSAEDTLATYQANEGEEPLFISPTVSYPRPSSGNPAAKLIPSQETLIHPYLFMTDTEKLQMKKKVWHSAVEDISTSYQKKTPQIDKTETFTNKTEFVEGNSTEEVKERQLSQPHSHSEVSLSLSEDQTTLTISSIDADSLNRRGAWGIRTNATDTLRPSSSDSALRRSSAANGNVSNAAALSSSVASKGAAARLSLNAGGGLLSTKMPIGDSFRVMQPPTEFLDSPPNFKVHKPRKRDRPSSAAPSVETKVRKFTPQKTRPYSAMSNQIAPLAAPTSSVSHATEQHTSVQFEESPSSSTPASSPLLLASYSASSESSPSEIEDLFPQPEKSESPAFEQAKTVSQPTAETSESTALSTDEPTPSPSNEQPGKTDNTKAPQNEKTPSAVISPVAVVATRPPIHRNLGMLFVESDMWRNSDTQIIHDNPDEKETADISEDQTQLEEGEFNRKNGESIEPKEVTQTIDAWTVSSKPTRNMNESMLSQTFQPEPSTSPSFSAEEPRHPAQVCLSCSSKPLCESTHAATILQLKDQLAATYNSPPQFQKRKKKKKQPFPFGTKQRRPASSLSLSTYSLSPTQTRSSSSEKRPQTQASKKRSTKSPSFSPLPITSTSITFIPPTSQISFRSTRKSFDSSQIIPPSPNIRPPSATGDLPASSMSRPSTASSLSRPDRPLSSKVRASISTLQYSPKQS